MTTPLEGKKRGVGQFWSYSQSQLRGTTGTNYLFDYNAPCGLSPMKHSFQRTAIKGLLAALWLTCGLLWHLPMASAQGVAQKAGVAEEDNLPARVIERGPHHRVYQIGNKPGRGYVELATGLHYWEDGRWQDSKEEIEIVNGSAIARHGQHQVIFAANLNSAGAIDMLSPDGKRFRSHLLGLAYTDAASGKSVMIAEVTDSIGAVQMPNKVFYANAFQGDCAADVRYTYSLGSFEQDVIIVKAPPSPEAWGLNPATTRLEVFTEFIELPEGGIAIPVIVKQEPDLAMRRAMVEPDLVDNRLDFGAMKFESGQAFPTDQADRVSEQNVGTGKSMELVDGRLILIEKVDYRSIEPQLKQLPQTAVVNPARKPGAAGEKMWAKALPPRPRGARGQWKERQYASIDSDRRGFVIDYVAVNGSLTNYAFRAGTTYFITNTLSLYGTTRCEGTAVIKLITASGIVVNGPIDCQTGAYRPLLITAKDDNTIGETVAGSTGSPSSYYGGNDGLYLKSTSAPYDLHDIHGVHCYRLFTLAAGVALNITNLQAGYGSMAFGQLAGTAVNCRNFLFYELKNYPMLITSSGTNRFEQGTIHRSSSLRSGTNTSNIVVTLTNCLIISVTNNLLYEGAYNATNLDDTGVFQTVGAGTHYLANGSPYRDAGTNNITPSLLSALKKQTTYPPVVINSTTNSLVLTPQAQRDIDVPDLGYHYNPLDFVLSSVSITNISIIATQGVAIGIRTLTGVGLGVYDGARFESTGTPTNLNRFVRPNVVQEKGNTNWTENAPGPYYNLYSSTAGSAPAIKVRFTEFSAPAGYENYHYYGTVDDSGSHNFRDSQFHSGYFWSDRPTLGVTNCLFNHTQVGLVENVDMNPTFRNSTFVASDLTLFHAGSGTWTFIDNLFDATTTNVNPLLGPFTNRFNAYTATAARLTPTNASDQVLSVTNITYASSKLGDFYLPTNLTSQSALFNKGSTNASLLTLYHYTTTTNQVKETNSVVDIGFHYVATDSNGIPLDSDGDGLSDYSEDLNGNGSNDTGETFWIATGPGQDGKDSDGDGVSDYLEILLGRNPTVARTTNDYTGSLKLRVFTPLR